MEPPRDHVQSGHGARRLELAPPELRARDTGGLDRAALRAESGYFHDVADVQPRERPLGKRVVEPRVIASFDRLTQGDE